MTGDGGAMTGDGGAMTGDGGAMTGDGRPATGDTAGGWGVLDLTVRFGDRVALEKVSLSVPAGRVIAVVGGDGAGKTTLLRALVRAVLPDQGEVRTPEAKRIGYLTAAGGAYPDLTVAENLDFAAAGYGVPAATARTRAREYLARTGLERVTGRLAGNLSGGMRRKLGVICAMLHEPDLLVLDEPTTGVDPVSRADVWWLVARAAARGAAVALSTTYLDEAERTSRVLVLDHGRVLVDGTADEITAAVPGTLRELREPPGPDAAPRSWRRGATWRVWTPDGTGRSPAAAAAGGAEGAGAVRSAGGAAGELVQPDLQDAVTIAALAREIEPAAASGAVAGREAR